MGWACGVHQHHVGQSGHRGYEVDGRPQTFFNAAKVCCVMHHEEVCPDQASFHQPASPNAKGPTLPVAHAITSPEFPGHSIHWTAWMIADKTNPNKIAYDSTLR